MNFVYHMISPKMIGPLLIPLNSLKNSYPEIYKEHASKYNGREELMNEVIPLLQCKWNDVLHLSPVEPKTISSALKSAGSYAREVNFYKIPIIKLDSNKTVIYKNNLKNLKLAKEDFIYFDHQCFENLLELPNETIAYYKSCIENQKRPLLFHGVPHVLTTQSLDISDCEIVCW